MLVWHRYCLAAGTIAYNIVEGIVRWGCPARIRPLVSWHMFLRRARTLSTCVHVSSGWGFPPPTPTTSTSTTNL